MNEWLQLGAAYLGSLGFAMLFNIHGRRLWLASLGGLLSWGVYLLAERFGLGAYFCGFCASVILTLYAELMAIFQKAPATVFLVSGAIPLIPGAALYRTMDSAVRRNWAGFADNGSYTLLFAACMAAGITFTTLIFEAIWSRRRRFGGR